MDRDSEADSVLWGGGKDEHAEAVLKIVNIAAKSLSDSTARTQTRQKTL
jgi:hypothetical protein